jgi:Trypsin-co-occurring domain 1
VAGRVVLVPIRVEDMTLLVEAVAAGGSENTSTIEKAQEAVIDAFERAQSAIVAVATTTLSTMRRLGKQAVRPDEIQVKFGLKFGAEGSIIVAGISAEATLEVTITYNGDNQGADRHAD